MFTRANCVGKEVKVAVVNAPRMDTRAGVGGTDFAAHLSRSFFCGYSVLGTSPQPELE